jgi:hypothetical protein
MIPELPKINSGFASCYPKFPNEIWVSGISGSGIPGSGFGLRGFCPVLISMFFSFCHDVIIPGRRGEYQVCATFFITMTKDFAMTTVLPPYEDMVAL